MRTLPEFAWTERTTASKKGASGMRIVSPPWPSKEGPGREASAIVASAKNRRCIMCSGFDTTTVGIGCVATGPQVGGTKRKGESQRSRLVQNRCNYLAYTSCWMGGRVV